MKGIFKKLSGKEKKYDIFISYRRDGGEFTARILCDKLEQKGYKVFFDVESMRSGNFNEKLLSVIEDCNDFIIVLSPNSLDRCQNENDWVRRELEHALKHNKNIIPVMLRNFFFPDELPESIAPLRYKNGLEADSNLFDAFFEKLLDFLVSTPHSKKHIGIALASIAAVVLICAAYMYNASLYPHTRTEKNVANQVLYYIETNLTYADIVANSLNDLYSECDRYFDVMETNPDRSKVTEQMKLCLNTISSLDWTKTTPSESLKSAMTDSAFSSADLLGMGDCVLSDYSSALDTISYFNNFVADPNAYLSINTRKKILDNYRQLLEENVKSYADATNQLLLPVTRRSALDEFKQKYLPTLLYIPLTATSWSDSYDDLEADLEKCNTKMNELMNNINSIVGDTNMENEKMKAKNEQMQKLIEQLSEQQSQ